MGKINIGIIGGAGYTAGELLRILLNHTNIKDIFIESNSHNGKLVSSVHCDLIGDTDLRFSKINYSKIDVVFLCMGHGHSKKFILDNNLPKHVKIIDLSSDYRFDNQIVYGLTELNKEKIKNADFIANPGCFATAMELSILPVIDQLDSKSRINISGITGTTGAGQKPVETSHFSWRNNNLSIYKPFTHQHLDELKHVLHSQNKDLPSMTFIPMRGCHARGILVSMTIDVKDSLESLKGLYRLFYADSPFVCISDCNPHLKQVANTNKAILYLEKYEDCLLVVCCIDNLLKGASGQAVQNMNVMFEFDEREGLQLKANYF